MILHHHHHSLPNLLTLLLLLTPVTSLPHNPSLSPPRTRTPLTTAWRFLRLPSTLADGLAYDLRPDHSNATNLTLLKPWILPAANPFLSDPATHHSVPTGRGPAAPEFAQEGFDDGRWEAVRVPHDWAVKGPFYVGEDVPVGGGMGRLPSQGVGWYRRWVDIPNDEDDEDGEDGEAHYYLDVDGAMAYASVWVNGVLAGGWPYGYNSFRVDLTGLVKTGRNFLAVRVDNPVASSRWYPGAGLYRNVWLTRVGGVGVGQWGTVVRTREGERKGEAVVELAVEVEMRGQGEKGVDARVVTEVHELETETGKVGKKVAEFASAAVTLEKGGDKQTVNSSVVIKNPKRWGPWTSQKPNLYVAVTSVYVGDRLADTYTTEFGIRTIVFDADKGLLVNGERIRIQGVNQHHDLGALGAAFNHRAAQRQLEILQDLGCNAIRMSHNPPAPELLELTDRMGFLVVDEIFDCWEREKNPNDFHLIFSDWAEPDLRAFLRRDRNHPSIIAWSVGNEVGEQYTDSAGAALAARLVAISHAEDPTRPATASMNYAKPTMPFPSPFDLISLNYQGEGIRDAPAYANLSGIKTPPLYPSFHTSFPNKLIFSSETAAALSSRGTYLFPVTNTTSSPVIDTLPSGGGDPAKHYVSAYELYTAPFGASADKVFASQDAHFPYVAGEFVWSGFDYLGEPTPYYTARSAYFGILDLAGFPKDRYFLYRARWRPELRKAHILPHWTWPGREGLVTPIHVFAGGGGKEAEVWVNGVSQGRVGRGAGSELGNGTSYRFRWDGVVYQPGRVRAVVYEEDGRGVWAEAEVTTAGEAAGVRLTADRAGIRGDGEDLSFVTVEVVDGDGNVVPNADAKVAYSLDGPGEIAATDNGDPTDMTSFVAKERKVFNGLGLVIVRASPGAKGTMTLKATAAGLKAAQITLKAL
ncbi:glycoside hydrolase superfamily [Staphylotrichum tortipilum]|uniref:Glycoside hydrolase superfamily n=1 Tax=Staphylotrichum tortipilum TaxID=2831512 RepID=A0AAN6MF04_9PEZI|nr:glycoside hydrolase superfamily [Staphylotrichum longicolle]